MNTQKTYGSVAKFLHWTIALLIILLISIGLYMTSLPDKDPHAPFWFSLHKSTGVLVFGLVIFRIFWRLINKVPDLPSTLPPELQFAARLSHFTLYGLLVVTPLTGFFLSVLSGYGVPFFDLYTFKPWLPERNVLSDLFLRAHLNLVYFWIAFLGLHISAALYHHYWLKDHILRRMLPWTKI